MIDLENADLSRLRARIVTDKGAMVLSFRPDKAPAHVKNFLALAQDGFYNETAFHRVISGFMIQGGCPNTKPGANGMPGTGGPGHHVHAEFNDLEHLRGSISMARAQDPNSAGSQFFLVHGEHADFLDGQYTNFGKIEEGLDVLDEIASVPCEMGGGGERSAPTERIGVQTVEVFEAESPGAGDTDGDAVAGDGDGGGDE